MLFSESGSNEEFFLTETNYDDMEDSWIFLKLLVQCKTCANVLAFGFRERFLFILGHRYLFYFYIRWRSRSRSPSKTPGSVSDKNRLRDVNNTPFPKKSRPYRPYFSGACYANATIFFLGLAQGFVKSAAAIVVGTRRNVLYIQPRPQLNFCGD